MESAVVSPDTSRKTTGRSAASGDRHGASDSAPVPSGGSLTCAPAVVTFTGGVGELIYTHAAGEPWPATTVYGDLGIDLAQRIVASPALSADIDAYRPQSAGRATALGLMRHSTEVSGSTLFLPDPGVLPLEDVPIFGTIDAATDDTRISALFDLVRHSERGGCVQVTVGSHAADAVRALGERMRSVLAAADYPADRLLVLLVRENVGKTLGQYVTRWGAEPWHVVAIDEVRDRDARYVRIGRPRSGIVPVSFYGLNDV
jgi:ethanolamine utilization protein EutA